MREDKTYYNNKIIHYEEIMEEQENQIAFLKEIIHNAMECIDADDALGAYDWLAKGMFVPPKEDK